MEITREQAFFERVLRELGLSPGYLIRAGFNPVEVEEVTLHSEPGCDIVLRPWRSNGIPMPSIRVVKVVMIASKSLKFYDNRGNFYTFQRDNPLWHDRTRNGTRRVSSVSG